MSTHAHTTAWRWRRVAGAAMLTGATALVIATWPSPASADPAVRTAWWNTVSGGGQSAPEPTAPDGGLHVAVAPGQILAFGAVLYDLAPDATATLELKVSGQGAPVLRACPTKDTSWKEGGDQSADAAPAFDCSLHSYTGSISSDGTTATFLLDGGADVTPGQLSLAIVPYMTNDAPAGVGTQLPTDATPPFSVDIAKPDVSSLTVTSLPFVPAPNGGGGGGSHQPASNPQSSGQTSSGQSGGSTPVTPTVNVPGSTQVSTPTDTGTNPQVAPPTGTVPAPASQPAAAGAPAPADNTAHNMALALLVLVAMVVVSSSNTPMQRQPRLLGGAGRHAAAAAPAAAAAVVATPLGVRGLGRFAKERNSAPRPLV
jgi:hypothetical protein